MTEDTVRALDIRVRGVVQGVGFRPFVFRLAHEHALAGWVLNGGDGVRIHVEGAADTLVAFTRDLETHPPAAAQIDALDVSPGEVRPCSGFSIVDSETSAHPTTPVSPDLPACAACVARRPPRLPARAVGDHRAAHRRTGAGGTGACLSPRPGGGRGDRRARAV